MFCPQCRAEYRPGFTRCSDCDVHLVDSPPARSALAAVDAWDRTATKADYAAQMWSGQDPHLYLALLFSVWNCRVPCLGRPVNPPLFDDDGKPVYQSASSVSFEIRVPEASLAFARWVLESSRETFEECENPKGATKAHAEPRDQPAWVCPLCLAEFDADVSPCPNCDVPLRFSTDRSTDSEAARVLCSLPHPEFSDAIRGALLDARIPFDNSGYSTRRTILSYRFIPSYRVIVLDSDYERATRVLAQVLQHWEFEPSSGFAPVPENPLESYWAKRADENGWFREDLTAVAWTGSNLETLISIAAALREYEIPYSVDVSKIGSGELLVHPEDDARAHELSRVVLQGIPLA